MQKKKIIKQLRNTINKIDRLVLLESSYRFMQVKDINKNYEGVVDKLNQYKINDSIINQLSFKLTNRFKNKFNQKFLKLIKSFSIARKENKKIKNVLVIEEYEGILSQFVSFFFEFFETIFGILLKTVRTFTLFSNNTLLLIASLLFMLIVTQMIVSNLITLIIMELFKSQSIYEILKLSRIISILFIAPITEEWCKNKAIRLNIAYQYTTIFAGTEFLLFMRKLSGTVSTEQAIKMRIPAIILHFLTTKFQKDLIDIDLENKSVAFILAVFMHFSSNAMFLLI